MIKGKIMNLKKTKGEEQVNINSEKMLNRFLIFAVMMVLCMGYAKAHICTVSGYVTDLSGDPVYDGFSVSVNNLGTLIEYPVKTGGNWPFKNYYSVSFSCSIGLDKVLVSAGGKEVEKDIESVETIVDISLDHEVEDGLDSGDDSSDIGGSGSTGGSSTGGSSGSGSSLSRNDDLSSDKIYEADNVQKRIYQDYVSDNPLSGELYIIDIVKGDTVLFSKEDVLLFYLGDVSSGIKSYILKVKDVTDDGTGINLSISRYNGPEDSMFLNKGIRQVFDVDGEDVEILYKGSDGSGDSFGSGSGKSSLYMKLMPDDLVFVKPVVEQPLYTSYMNWLLFFLILSVILMIVFRAYPLEKVLYDENNNKGYDDTVIGILSKKVSKIWCFGKEKLSKDNLKGKVKENKKSNTKCNVKAKKYSKYNISKRGRKT